MILVASSSVNQEFIGRGMKVLTVTSAKRVNTTSSNRFVQRPDRILSNIELAKRGEEALRAPERTQFEDGKNF